MPLGERVSSKWAYGNLSYVGDKVVQIFDQQETGSVFNCFPGTQGQYTGLKDKNEREIYEGDVLNYTNGTYRPDGKTKHEPHVTRIIVTIDSKGLYCNVSHFSLVTNSLEVIGNIHENPDLLP